MRLRDELPLNELGTAKKLILKSYRYFYFSALTHFYILWSIFYLYLPEKEITWRIT
jgi:hypothetical protein